MNRTPALTKNEMRPKTAGIRSAGTRSATASRIASAVLSENAISCTGVAPASCRW